MSWILIQKSLQIMISKIWFIPSPRSQSSWDQHGAHLGPEGPDGPHVGPMNLATRGINLVVCYEAISFIYFPWTSPSVWVALFNSRRQYILWICCGMQLFINAKTINKIYIRQLQWCLNQTTVQDRAWLGNYISKFVLMKEITGIVKLSTNDYLIVFCLINSITHKALSGNT